MRSVIGRWHEERPPDLVDLLGSVDTAVSEFPRLDPGRLGVMGGSYGGLATVMVAASDSRYRSAVAERGLYAWPSFGGTSDIGGWFAEAYLGPDQSWEKLRQSSVLARADAITTPTLVVHSESDWRCPIEQAEQLFTLLLRNGVDTELVRFPAGQGHELSRSGKPKLRVERLEIILDWHRRHLG